MTVPLQTFDLVSMTEGQAILVIGLLGLLAFMAVQLRNPAAMVAWGLSVIMLVLSAILELGTEWLWLGIIATAMLVLIGAVVRWMS